MAKELKLLPGAIPLIVCYLLSSAGEANMRVTCEEYLHLVVEQVSFKVSVLCKVGETNQIYADDDTFRLRRPDIAIKVQYQLSSV